MNNSIGDKMASERKVTVDANEEMLDVMHEDDIQMVQAEDDFLEEENSREVEDLPDDEEIWPGGPTAGLIKVWKNEYGEVYVTSLSFDKHIVWRTLSRLEYKNLVKRMEQLVQAGQLSSAEANMWNEEAIAEICILYPSFDKQALTKEMAGMPSLISQEVLEASGFVALEVRQL
jgi:hypothetical protein